jgi:uncharacterized protein (TIGR02466 family)
VEILEKNGLVSLLMVNELELCEKKESDVLYKKPEVVALRGSLQYSQLATIDNTDIFLARITSIKFLNNVVSAAKWRKSWDTGRMISNRGGWQSHTDFLSGVHMSGNELIDTTMVTLRNTIQNFVWMSLKHSPEYKDLRIEQIDAHSVWAQISNKGNWNSRHTHGYGWSGVLYIDADDKGSLLELYDPRPQSQSSVLRHLYGFGTNFLFKPTPGMFILFPSWLVHSVTIHNQEKERICIAFNVDVKTDIKEDVIKQDRSVTADMGSIDVLKMWNTPLWVYSGMRISSDTFTEFFRKVIANREQINCRIGAVNPIKAEIEGFVYDCIRYLSEQPSITGNHNNHFIYQKPENLHSLTIEKVKTQLHTLKSGSIFIDPLVRAETDSDLFGLIILPFEDSTGPFGGITTKMGISCSDSRPVVEAIPTSKTHMYLSHELGLVYMVPSWAPCSFDVIEPLSYPIDIGVLSFSIWLTKNPT